MPDPYAPRLIEELKTHGVHKWEMDDTGKHNKLYFQWKDRTLMHVFPKTPSDHRGLLNSIACLRRTMGVGKKKITPPKKVEAVKCPMMTLAQICEILNSSKQSNA